MLLNVRLLNWNRTIGAASVIILTNPKDNARGKQLVYMRITIDAARLELFDKENVTPNAGIPRPVEVRA